MAAIDRPGAATPQISVRSARPSDRDPVLAFCAQTWDFGDYIGQVWDRWLNDAHSDLLVGVDGGDRPIALGHVRLAAPGEVWLEGLRVDPAVRRQGIAEVMCREAVAASERRGARQVRFATLATNTPVHRLAPRLGFRKVAGFGSWRAPAAVPARDADAPILTPVEDHDFDAAAAGASGTDTVRALADLAVSGWTYARLAPERLREWTATGGRLYRVSGPSAGPAFVWIDAADDPEGALPVPWIAANAGAVEATCRAMRQFAGQLGRSGADLRLTEGKDFSRAAEAAGFTPVGDFAFWIYEYQSGPADAGPAGESA